MHVRIVAVGDRQPAWVDSAFADYANRLPPQWRFRFDAVATVRRGKGIAASAAKNEEGTKLLAKLKPADFVVALDEKGKQSSSRDLAGKIDGWQTIGADIAFVLGGPDGLSQPVLDRANYQWCLSSLTFPHGLARVMVAEQLYRACSLLSGHPYHRD